MTKTKTACVKFMGNSKPFYFKCEVEKLKKDDRVLVDTANGEVIGIFKGYSTGWVKPTKHVIKKIGGKTKDENKVLKDKVKYLELKVDSLRSNVVLLEQQVTSLIKLSVLNTENK